MEYKEFEAIANVENFKRGVHKMLQHTLEDFYGAKVRLVFSPIVGIKTAFDIDITEEPKRELYRVENRKDVILLTIYVQRKDTMYFLGIQLQSPLMPYIENSIFHSTCINIGRRLTEAADNAFRSCSASFNETLAKEIVVGYIGVGRYDISKISYLIDLFLGLRSTTFEGKYFSTGLIVSKSVFAYKKKEKYKKNGRFLRLAKKSLDVDISDKQNTRFWYLADGYRTFFLTDLKKTINSMFVYEGTGGDYVGEMLLSKTLQGADALFRVSKGRELSVVNSEGYEFLHQENKWKFRDYNGLKTCILEIMPNIKSFYDELIKCVLYCSKNDTSSIIWVPKDINTIKDIVSEKTMNEFGIKPIVLKEATNLPIVKRLLSSDGATVIDKEGRIRYFGCIADLSKATIRGIRGTGETAASLLAQNGIAIKISQDGPIKIFIEGIEGHIPF